MVNKGTGKKTNKGTGAGGANTNEYGITFEKDTCISDLLISKGFIRHSDKKYKGIDFLYKETEERYIIHVKQGNFGKWMNARFNTNFEFSRNPDTAFIIIDKTNVHIYIIEKKEQRVEGSVIDKLLASPLIKEEYQYCLQLINTEYNFTIDYTLCLNHWLYLEMFPEKKENPPKIKAILRRKSNILSLERNNIKIIEDKDYADYVFNEIIKN